MPVRCHPLRPHSATTSKCRRTTKEAASTTFELARRAQLGSGLAAMNENERTYRRMRGSHAKVMIG